MACCEACGLAQYVTNPTWQREADSIYKGYTIYHQSGGIEQSVFSQSDSKGSLRSDVIVESLLKFRTLPEKGKLLDIGCGNGGFIKACSPALPQWDLYGSEVDDKYKEHVEALPGVVTMHAGELSEIHERFDLITLIHVLEHIPAPSDFLKSLERLLNPGGIIFVEVPNCSVNPFALLIADHSSHFSKESLGMVGVLAGYSTQIVTDQWVSRELSMVLGSRASEDEEELSLPCGGPEVLLGVTWLGEVHEQIRLMADSGEFGVFGTSIAATALEAQTGNKASFFVDEDPNRRGKTHLGKPILAPDMLKAGSSVYVALAEPQASAIRARLEALGIGLKIVTPRALK